MNNPIVIIPYLFEEDVQPLIERLNNTYIDYIIEADIGRIGPDLMYQKLWKKTNQDVIILHTDMMPLDSDQDNKWFEDLCNYANQYKEAGILGCKLLYPAKHQDTFVIQYAGGKFSKDGVPEHFGSGLDINTGSINKELELDKGQYDCIREVAWATFGGIYIKREVINAVGDFDPMFEWSYNRDVDYCLTARSKGYKIYQTPCTLLHYESRDVKKIRTPELVQKEIRNLTRLKDKWQRTDLYSTIDEIIK